MNAVLILMNYRKKLILLWNFFLVWNSNNGNFYLGTRTVGLTTNKYSAIELSLKHIKMNLK